MTAELKNKAAWILQPKGEIVVDDAEVPTPGEGELLVKIECIAFSPIESKIQRFGIHPIPYPSILGTSFSGSVIQPHPTLATLFPAGTHVAVNRIGATISDSRFGGFQKYALAKATSTSRLHPSTPVIAGGAIIINLAATVSPLHLHLHLTRPPLTNTPAAPLSRTVLVYGGTSQCGALAIKYLSSAGYTVISTTSPTHHAFTSALGATHLIDHTQPAPAITTELTSYGPYTAIFDAIGLPPVTDILCAYLGSLPQGANKSYATLLPLFGREKEIPQGVERKFAPYAWSWEEPANTEARDWFYNEYVPKGLESGLIPVMPTERVEGGLGSVGAALDRMGDGKVSGTKLIMDPWA